MTIQQKIEQLREELKQHNYNYYVLTMRQFQITNLISN